MSHSTSTSYSTSASTSASTSFVAGVAVGLAAASVSSRRNDGVSEKDYRSNGVNFYDYYGTKLSFDFSKYSDCANSTFYTHPSNYDGRFGGSGILKRYSRRIGGALSLGVHHFLILDTEYWYYVYEWMDDSRAHVGVTKSLRNENGLCTEYQRENIKDVWEAVKNATLGKNYSSDYNCNHWCDRVLHQLGYKGADTHWNCKCVTNSHHPAWIKDACNII